MTTTHWKCSCTPDTQRSRHKFREHLACHGITPEQFQRVILQTPLLHMRQPLPQGIHQLMTFAIGDLIITRLRITGYARKGRYLVV